MLNTTSEVIVTPQLVLALWKHEAYRVIADRFTTFEDKEWFEKEISKIVEEDCGSVLAQELAAEPYFVDFMREAPEPTGRSCQTAPIRCSKQQLSRKNTPLHCCFV